MTELWSCWRVTVTDAPAESPHVASPNKILTKILSIRRPKSHELPRPQDRNHTAQAQQPLPDSQTVRLYPSLTPLAETNLRESTSGSLTQASNRRENSAKFLRFCTFFFCWVFSTFCFSIRSRSIESVTVTLRYPLSLFLKGFDERRRNPTAVRIMQTRYMEKSSSAARGKRGLDSGSTEEEQPEKKRPALARWIISCS